MKVYEITRTHKGRKKETVGVASGSHVTVGFRESSSHTGRDTLDPVDNRWLSVVVMMNLSLWISMLYAVLKINDYAIRRQYYNTTWWLIFIIPLLAFMFLLLSPCRNYLKKIRTDFPNHWRCKLITLSLIITIVCWLTEQCQIMVALLTWLVGSAASLWWLCISTLVQSHSTTQHNGKPASISI